jgi:6-phospho-beta-glucosidase
MKLTILGGGGVRSPLLVATALRHASKVGLTELCLMDINGPKLEIMGTLCKQVNIRAGSPIKITTTTQAQEALEGADYVVTTIRVGEEAGRILDERIALRNGVLGQETTGPGGFAMAMRSIPVILKYAEMLEKLNPKAWIFNFTNPAGLVAQALHQRGFKQAVGICDSANHAQMSMAVCMDVDLNELRAEVFGLNHLSWTRRVTYNGEDMLPKALNDPGFRAGSMMRIFEPELVEQFGMFLNEYLFYYYYREQALARISGEEMTRGEEIMEWNKKLFSQLNKIGYQSHPDEALEVYYTYNQHRASTYMSYAQSEKKEEQKTSNCKPNQARLHEMEEEGYAGVALNILAAFKSGELLYTALNVPNQGAISGMQDDDVVEISCVVNKDGIRPLPIGEIPASQLTLMRSVKLYERLTVDAILKRSRAGAVLALMNHPLVGSYSIASKLVDEYLKAHAAYVGEWK